MKTTVITLMAIAATSALATEFHVATHGHDVNRGTKKAPLRSIQRAADLAQPGDVITVHEGVYDTRAYPLQTGGNISYHHAQAYAGETNQVVLAELDPQVKLVEQGGQFILHFTPGPELHQARTTFVTTKRLGQARIPGLPYEDADGSPLKISADYFGKKRSTTKPTPGPFENPDTGPIRLKVWSLRETVAP